MARADALIAVGRLVTAYGQERISEERVALYAEKLADVPGELLQATVDRIMESSKFFPAISELRHLAARLAGLLPPSGPEALAIVRRADLSYPVFRRDGRYAYTERQWQWPEELEPVARELIRDTLMAVGEPVDGEGKPYFGWENGFQKTYEAEAEIVERAALSDLSRAALAPRDRLRLTGGG